MYEGVVSLFIIIVFVFSSSCFLVFNLLSRFIKFEKIWNVFFKESMFCKKIYNIKLTSTENFICFSIFN